MVLPLLPSGVTGWEFGHASPEAISRIHHLLARSTW